MIIALITDIHDNKDSLHWAFREITASEAEHIICLGDLANPGIMKLLSTAPLPVFCVFGNNDGDRVRMTRIADEKESSITLAACEWGSITLDGKTYFCTHYPELAEHAATSGKYAAVFHGHTHRKRNDMINDVPIINPGKLAIYPTEEPISIALYDTYTHDVRFIDKQ